MCIRDSYAEMGKTIGRDLIGQFLRDDDIADSFSVYYNLFDKYRSDYQIMNILAGGAGLDIINRARGAEFDERVALLGLMLDAVANSCAHALEQEEVVIELRDILRDAKPKLLEGAAGDDTVGAVSYTHLDVYKRQPWSRAHDAQSSRRCHRHPGHGRFGYLPGHDSQPRCWRHDVCHGDAAFRLSLIHI